MKKGNKLTTDLERESKRKIYIKSNDAELRIINGNYQLKNGGRSGDSWIERGGLRRPEHDTPLYIPGKGVGAPLRQKDSRQHYQDAIDVSVLAWLDGHLHFFVPDNQHEMNLGYEHKQKCGGPKRIGTIISTKCVYYLSALSMEWRTRSNGWQISIKRPLVCWPGVRLGGVT